MAFLWTGSQIPVYLFGMTNRQENLAKVADNAIGGIPPYIYGAIGGADRWIWFV